MTIAVVDIGTNSTRLLVAQYTRGTLCIVHRDLVTTRLGAGLMEHGVLSMEGKEATAAAVRRFAGQAGKLKAAEVLLLGTSAMREAQDGPEFARLLERDTGCRVEILSAEAEAFYSYRGAVKSLPQYCLPVVFDLGGGSCELAWENGLLQTVSLKIGAVYVTDTFFLQDPPTAGEVAAAAEHIRTSLMRVCPQGRPLIGVGGTVTNLAAMALELSPYSPEAVHGFILERGLIKSQLERMLTLKTADREQLQGIQKNRAAILPAGTLVVDMLLELCNSSQLVVSEGDLLLGRLYGFISEA
ncbi:MAG: hypothetical protein SCK29_02970 [Bacillota bacterium]|nr:hypothetical protein [Bacillota bacterium]MDW7683065.1 hypothetical protein [Bacillota bacterium]